MVDKLKSISKYLVFAYGLFALIQNYVISEWPSNKKSNEEVSQSVELDSNVVVSDTLNVDSVAE